MLKVHDKTPNFSLPDANGVMHSLNDYLGKKVIVYFYPRDNTPGCTDEACQFRDAHTQFVDNNVVIIGISKDSAKSHANFIAKYDLPFVLLSDPEHEVIEAYGAWGEKKLYGKTYMGIMRSTIVIDEEGRVISADYKVKVKGHIDKLLEELGIKS